MKKKHLCYFLFMASLLLSGCQSGWESRYNFAGESTNWYVNYQVTPQSKKSESAKYKIQYTGKGAPPAEISYSIETNSGSSKGTDELNEDGVLIKTGSWCDGCAITQEDQDVKVMIKWGGQMETFSLQPSEEGF